MSKVAVVYWSGTGNTEAMADLIAEGVREAGGTADVIECSQFGPDQLDDFDAFAFGCPAMGAEVLEESEFEPFFTELEGRLSGKKVVLFGSYGWGDGQWMRDWADRLAASGAAASGEPLIVNEAPDDDGLAQCRALGAALAGA